MERGGRVSSNLAIDNIHARNLKKSQLGGVVFVCTNNTIRECLLKQLFGLPGQHFSYVKNIDPGLPLFLFNYSDRKLYGIYEAASSGQMNINSYGWTSDGAQRTPYPAQVLDEDVDNQRGKDQFDVTAVEQEEKELILKKLQELALRSEPQASSLRDGTENSPPMHDMHLEEKASAEEQMGSKEKNDDNPCTFCQPTVSQLVQGMEELKAFRTQQTLKMGL